MSTCTHNVGWVFRVASHDRGGFTDPQTLAISRNASLPLKYKYHIKLCSFPTGIKRYCTPKCCVELSQIYDPYYMECILKNGYFTGLMGASCKITSRFMEGVLQNRRRFPSMSLLLIITLALTHFSHPLIPAHDFFILFQISSIICP